MKDLFSKHASNYAQFRPVYPDELYQFIYSYLKHFDFVWDAGTGNGQAAHVLARRFRKVRATDISASQLKQATRAHNVIYSIAAEEIDQPESSVDLITVAQAIHWFDIKKFFACVNRVGKPDAVIAVWGYGLLTINPEIDKYINHFYKNIVGPYWDPERKLIDDRYQTIPFPFTEVHSPLFSFSFQWPLSQLAGYLNTWSAVRKYIAKNKNNPVEPLIEQLHQHWKQEMKVTFPLFLRLGHIKKPLAK